MHISMKKIIIGLAFLVLLPVAAHADIFDWFKGFLPQQQTFGATLFNVQQGGTGWGNITAGTLLTGNGTGRLATTSIGSGLTLSGGVLTSTGSGFAYLFPSNATTTGLGIYASTTIGDGTQAGGLTISGGATTTGNLIV